MHLRELLEMHLELFWVAIVIDATCSVESASAAVVRRHATFVMHLACELFQVCKYESLYLYLYIKAAFFVDLFYKRYEVHNSCSVN